MKISKMRKIYPFYEQRGHLVYIGGVQRKLNLNEEHQLFNALLRRKIARFGRAIGNVVKGLDLKRSVEHKTD